MSSSNLRQNLSTARRIVIKVGTTSITNSSGELDKKTVKKLVDELSKLKITQHKEIILVTSGAIGAGLAALGFKQRPKLLSQLQMTAAVGQSKLMAEYDRFFSLNKIASAQVLLTHADIKSRSRSSNISKLLDLLLKSNVIPVINENDAVSVDEIRVGDNDLLACMVAILAKADLLVFLTSSDGVLTSIGDNSSRLSLIPEINSRILSLANGKTSKLSTGGMQTKLQAAKKALKHKIPSLIMNSNKISSLDAALNGSDFGTQIGLLKKNKY